MTTTRLKGSVLGMCQPADSSAETVDTTSAQSSTLSVHSPPEIARPTKLEVAPKPVVTRQPSVLAPLSQMWTDNRFRFSVQLSLLEPSNLDHAQQLPIHSITTLELTMTSYPQSTEVREIIDEAIDQWRARLNACVRAKGGHFEHRMSVIWMCDLQPGRSIATEVECQCKKGSQSRIWETS